MPDCFAYKKEQTNKNSNEKKKNQQNNKDLMAFK